VIGIRDRERFVF